MKVLTKLNKIIIVLMGASLVFANVAESFTQNISQVKAVKTAVGTSTLQSELVPKLKSGLVKNSESKNSNQKSNNELTVATSDTASKIVSIWGRGDKYYIQINLTDYNTDISISAYNMIGKEVKKIYTGSAKSKGEYYDFAADDLPNGVYFCVMQGKNFRSAEKFIISRK